MGNPNTTHWFDDKAAATYDERTKGWAAGRDALFSLMRFVLSELRPQPVYYASVREPAPKCWALAAAFPGWRFTALEPAPAMLKLCREKAEAAGLAARCTFHDGFLDSLPTSEPFDAASCLLVSHFFKDASERTSFFHQIAARLCEGGYLINSDLILGHPGRCTDSLLEVWIRLLRESGHPDEGLSKLRETYGRDVVAITTSEMESMLIAGGFETPVLFYQTLLMHRLVLAPRTRAGTRRAAPASVSGNSKLVGGAQRHA